MAYSYHDSVSNCAVTALSTSIFKGIGSENESHEKKLVYCGSGSTLSCFDLSTGECQASHRILFGSNIHGVVHSPVSGDTTALVYGERNAKLVDLSSYHVNFDFGLLDDWIWDAKIIPDCRAESSDAQTKKHALRVAFALAQGFVEVWKVELAPSPRAVRVSRVLCGAQCIMYSMRFWPVGQDSLWVASGTVFNKVIVWNAAAEGAESDLPVVPVAQTLDGHNGAVFRVKWSADGTKLCSVSDDRTVKLWEVANGEAGGSGRPGTLVLKWSSYGHRSRVWDCDYWAGGVVSVGEDCTAQVWSWQGGKLAALQVSTGRNCWRCTVDWATSTLVTGGADGSVKLWDLGAITSSGAETGLPDQVGQRVEVPRPIPALDSVASQHNGVSETVTNIVLLDDKEAYVQTVSASFDSFIWALDLEDQSTWRLVLDSRWAEIADAMAGISRGQRALSVLALSSRGADPWLLAANRGGSLVVAPRGGRVAGGASVTNQHHRTPIVLVRAVGTCQSGHRFATGSVDGTLKVCTVSEQDPVVSVLCTVRMERPATPLSACLFAPGGGAELLVAGDARGSVHLWSLPGGEVAPQYGVLAKAHGRDKVTEIAVHNGRLYSGGHNGTVVELRVLPPTDQSPDWIRVAGTRLRATAPVSSVERLSWRSDQPEDMTIAGFHAGEFVVYDLADQHVRTKIQCGGWNRPYAAHTAQGGSSDLVLVFAPSKGKKTAGDARRASVQVVVQSPFQSPSFQRNVLRRANHGRVIWDTRWFAGHAGRFFATASEDHAIRLYQVAAPEGVRASPGEEAKWSDPGMFKPGQSKVQHDVLPFSTLNGHLSAVRCLDVVPLTDSSLLMVSGGGQDQMCCWRLDMSDGQVKRVEMLCERVDAMSRDDVQRVLSVNVLPAPEHDAAIRHIAASDSSGKVVIYQLQINDLANVAAKVKQVSCGPNAVKTVDEDDHVTKKRVVVGKDATEIEKKRPKRQAKKSTGDSGRHVFRPTAQANLTDIITVQESGNKPVLCTAHCQTTSGDVLLWSGSTNGSVHVWKIDSATSRSELLTSFQAHKMGVNCIAAETMDSRTIRVVTGGDDQALTVAWLSSTDKNQWNASTCSFRGVRIMNADASALRSVRLSGDMVLAVGLNQRLRSWKVTQDDFTQLKEPNVIIESKVDNVSGKVGGAPVQLVHAIAVDVSDATAMDVCRKDDAQYIILGGAGIQMLVRNL